MTADPAALFAAAKINLTLHVTGKRDDGYHLLDSLVVFADVGDRILLDPGDVLTLEVGGPFADGVPADRRNLVWQAAARAGWRGHIWLEKNLPHGAGIGGGSSDAAAMLRHLDAVEHAADLGADVPVCLLAQAQRMRGMGEVLTPLATLPPLPAVLVNPRVHVPTAQAFNSLKSVENTAMPDVLPDFTDAGGLIDWLRHMRNDLQPPASQIAPVIRQVLETLRPLCPLARMSGSGATCFALFEDAQQAHRAADGLRADHPEWWVVACTLS